MARSAQGVCPFFLLLLGACGGSNAPPSPPDAASDATAPVADAAVADAAVPDTGPGSDTGGYCAATGPHYFCDDFDEDPLAHDWDSETTQHGALTLDAARATSSPFALLASSPALENGAVTTAALAKQIVDTPPHLHVAFDLAADALDPAGAAATVLVVDLLAADGSISEVLALEARSSGGMLVDTDGGSFTAQHPFAWPQLASGAFSRVQLDVVFAAPDGDAGDASSDGGGGGAVSLSLDGQMVIDAAAMAPGAQPSLPTLQLGLVTLAGPSAAVAVRFDDFTFATLP